LEKTFYPNSIQILSRFYPDFSETHFIQILSKFYPDFILNSSRLNLDKIWIKGHGRAQSVRQIKILPCYQKIRLTQIPFGLETCAFFQLSGTQIVSPESS
jgi:hypothetical protein